MGNQSNVGQPLVQASLIGEAIDAGPVAVFVADEELRFLAVNGFATSVLGYERDEVLALAVTDLSPDPDVRQRVRDLLKSGARLDGITELRAKDGRLVQFEGRAQRAAIAGMTVFVWAGWPVDDASSAPRAPRRRSGRAPA
jgi:PAS domain S-box-containing protein